MIRSEKREFIAVAAIAILVLLALVPAGVAAATIFEDDFESGNLDKWDTQGDPDVVGPLGGRYVSFDDDNDEIHVHLDTTCWVNISLSYRRNVSNMGSSEFFKVNYSTNGGSTWPMLEQIRNAPNWTTVNFNLPPAANNNDDLRVRFRLDDGDDAGEWAHLDDVFINGTPLQSALEVTKEVLDNESWVTSVNASINDTLQFKSTITNTGEVNLTQIRFWDVLDCSLEFKDAPGYPCTDSYIFKPKVLHPDDSWCLNDPWEESFTELCPVTGTSWQIVDWEDTTNRRGNVSACDQIELKSTIFEDDFENWTAMPTKWWYYDDVTQGSSSNHYVVFHDNGDDLKSVAIGAACKLSFKIQSDHMGGGDDHFYVNYSTDNSTWTTLANIQESCDHGWETFTYNLPCNQNLWLWFSMVDGTDADEYVYLDDVRVTCQDWYHVDRVPYTLNLSNATYGTKYFDSVLNWDEVNLSDPNGTEWFGLCGCKDEYTLLNWSNQPCSPIDNKLSKCDLVTMRNERTGEEVQYTVEEVAKDLVVSREWEIADPLKPEDTITIEYNATVVRCGVDNNTFVAKGLGCDDTWTYSDPAVVTVTVPCAAPSGEATDPIGLAKEVYTLGEPVYGVGSGFAANKDVDIYILPFMTLVGGEDLDALKIFGPVNVQTDANGDIGAVNPVLVWPNPTPGHYLMVFDDPDGDFDPGADPLDDFTVIGTALVPLVTPPGIVALFGLLSIVATGTLVKKRRD